MSDDDVEAHEPGEEREYQVIFTGTATTYVTVNATHPTYAVEKAEDELGGSLCWHCGYPQNTGFRSTGPVEREWPEYMEVDEVTVDGQKCDPGDY